ncbi:MAG: hypothetical protein MR210_08520 [Erysipelotrichaceae bacterium]|nr:hypothetical protein [Erysipelotrichaceae bacterium]
MKKLFSFICVVLLCCVVNVHASDEDPVAACEAQSDETKVCAVNENGECECKSIIDQYEADKQNPIK